MANPNRAMAHVGLNPTAYWTFPKPFMAARFASAAKAMGLKVRESSFRIGPRNENRRSYRVSVYWTAAGPAPDMDALDAAAKAARD